jgi:hypothetical protein
MLVAKALGRRASCCRVESDSARVRWSWKAELPAYDSRQAGSDLLCDAERPRPRLSARATSRAVSHRPHDSHARGGGVRARDASRCGDEPQMLQIRPGASSGELVVRREHRAQRIERVLARLLACPVEWTWFDVQLDLTRDLTRLSWSRWSGIRRRFFVVGVGSRIRWV